MIALGPLLGGPGETVAALRPVVRAGGWIVIDDAYLDDASPPSPDWQGYRDLPRTEAGLTRHGDPIVARRHRGPAIAAFNALALRVIRRRAGRLARRRPGLRAVLDHYVARQARAAALMDGPVVPALWVIRKADA